MYIADLSHTFLLLHGYQQVPHTEYLDQGRKGHPYSGDRGFYTPIMERRIKRKLGTRRTWAGKLKPELRLSEIPSGSFDPRFIVSGEISTIYKKNGRTRKVHSPILLPGLDVASSFRRIEKSEISILTAALF